MSDDRIEALKRRARLLARERGIGRQKALDVVAVEEGHRHWGALLASLPASDTEVAGTPVAIPSRAPVARDRALDHLDILSGARTSRFDETALNAVGSFATGLVGTGPIGVAISCAAAAILAALVADLPKIAAGAATPDLINLLSTIVFAPVAAVIGLACWHSPHSVRYRGVRHVLEGWWICTGALLGLVTAASLKDAPFAFGPTPLESALSLTGLFGAAILPMWIGTYAGRRVP